MSRMTIYSQQYLVNALNEAGQFVVYGTSCWNLTPGLLEVNLVWIGEHLDVYVLQKILSFAWLYSKIEGYHLI